MPSIKEDKAKISLNNKESDIQTKLSKAKVSLIESKTKIVSESVGVNSTGNKQLYDSGLLYDSSLTYDDYNGSPVYGERASVNITKG